MTVKKQDYQTLSIELEEVLAALQDPEVRVDEAVVLYERGLKIIGQLEAHLTSAENKITKLTLQAAVKE